MALVPYIYFMAWQTGRNMSSTWNKINIKKQLCCDLFIPCIYVALGHSYSFQLFICERYTLDPLALNVRYPGSCLLMFSCRVVLSLLKIGWREETACTGHHGYERRVEVLWANTTSALVGASRCRTTLVPSLVSSLCFVLTLPINSFWIGVIVALSVWWVQHVTAWMPTLQIIVAAFSETKGMGQ